MIISQWTAKSDDCPDCGDPWCMGCNFNVQRESTPRELAEDMRDYEAMRGNPQQMSHVEERRQMANEMAESLVGDEYAVTLDAEMVAALNAERAEHARFGCETHGNLEGDPIARGLTSEEEDAEVGRLWGIDASRTEGGE